MAWRVETRGLSQPSGREAMGVVTVVESGRKGRDSPEKQKNLAVSITDWIYMGGY